MGLNPSGTPCRLAYYLKRQRCRFTHYDPLQKGEKYRTKHCIELDLSDFVFAREKRREKNEQQM